MTTVERKSSLVYSFPWVLAAVPWIASYVFMFVDILIHRRSYWPMATGSALWASFEVVTATEEKTNATKKISYGLFLLIDLSITTLTIIYGSGQDMDEFGILPMGTVCDRLRAFLIYSFCLWTFFRNSKLGRDKGVVFSLWGLTHIGMLRLSFQPSNNTRVFYIVVPGNLQHTLCMEIT